MPLCRVSRVGSLTPWPSVGRQSFLEIAFDTAYKIECPNQSHNWDLYSLCSETTASSRGAQGPPVPQDCFLYFICPYIQENLIYGILYGINSQDNEWMKFLREWLLLEKTMGVGSQWVNGGQKDQKNLANGNQWSDRETRWASEFASQKPMERHFCQEEMLSSDQCYYSHLNWEVRTDD